MARRDRGGAEAMISQWPDEVGLVRVEHAYQVELLREAYNSSRAHLARPGGITARAQHTWWKRIDRARVHPYLLVADVAVLGYGMLRKDDDGLWWASGAVMPQCRGDGYGRALFSLLVALCPEDTWLSVREDNEVAHRLYSSLGFEEMYRRACDHSIIMVKRRSISEPWNIHQRTMVPVGAGRG